MKINKALLISSLLISFIFLSSSICNAAFISSAPVAMSGNVPVTAIGPVLDNFDSMTDENNWGGQYSPLNIGSGRSITISRDSTTWSGGGPSGACLKVAYNVPISDDYIGIGIGLANQPVADIARDISSAKTFFFDIKGASAGQSFKIEWKKHEVSTTSILYLSDYLDQTTSSNSGTGTDWQTVNIPIDAFANFSSSITNLSEINLIFENSYLTGSGMNTSDTIWLDNIGFSTTAQNAVRIDHFGDAWGLDALGGNIGTSGNIGTAIGYDLSYSSPSPRSLALNYNIPTDDYSGIWFKVGGGSDKWTAVSHDFSAYNYLKIRVKLASETNYPSKVKLELQDAGGVRWAYIPDNTFESSVPLTTTWHEYTVSLEPIDGLQKDSISQFSIVIEQNIFGVPNRVGSDSGTVYFDSIRFEK